MRVFLDEQAIEIQRAGGSDGQTPDSVAAAIAAARAAAQANGRVIIDVRVNGERLDDDALDSPSDSPAGDIEFKCFSADPRQLVAESFVDVSLALEGARPAQREAADSLQTGNLEAAFEQLAGALEVWDAVHRVTEQGPALLGVTLASLHPSGGSIEKDLATLSATLQQVRDAVGTQDWSTLADLLGHDLDDAACRWARLLAEFGDRASAQPGRGGGA